MRSIGFLSLILVGCAATPSTDSGVIADTSRKIKAGEVVTYKLDPGRYHLELTSSHDGVRVEWLGSSCSHARLVKQLNTDCELKQTGQLVIENPSSVNLGGLSFGNTVSTTIRLVKRPANP